MGFAKVKLQKIQSDYKKQLILKVIKNSSDNLEIIGVNDHQTDKKI